MATAPSSAPKPSTYTIATHQDLLKQIRSHDIGIAELSSLPSTRNNWILPKPSCSNSDSKLSHNDSLYSLISKKMALRGVWQMNKLIVSYCNWAGSSRGMREFMESHLPAFKEVNPHLEVVTELNRGQHPYLKGIYLNKNERVVCVKNMTPEDVLFCATRLRNSLGRKVVKLRTRHLTKNPSVQGTWTTDLKI